MKLPTLIPESQIHPFNYYWEGEVRSGMTLNGRLYAQLERFPKDNRAAAYEAGCQLATDYDVIITVGKDAKFYYTLWIALGPGTKQVLESYSSRQRSIPIRNPRPASDLPKARLVA